MSARFPDLHDYLLRVPLTTWAKFTQFVEAQRPKRSVNQQIVFMMEEAVRGLEGAGEVVGLGQPETPPDRPRKKPAASRARRS